MEMELPIFGTHNAAVVAISEKVKCFYRDKRPFRIYHGSTNSTRNSPYRHDNIVDTSRLNHVLAIDKEKRLAFVEPNVAMDQLVTETTRLGLVPPVVMEFPGITTGGGFAGTAGESSSFRYGFFDRTVKVVEMVLGNGDIVLASENIRPDLFHGAASSFGTLGIVTMLVLDLLVAKPYVALHYLMIRSMKEAVEKIQQEQNNLNLDYIDGVFFTKDRGVLCLGTMTDVPPLGAELKRFLRAEDDWFYINAEKAIAERESWTEAIPLKDYLFRYDRGAFWIGKYTYRYFSIPCNWFTRWMLNEYTHTRVMYQALHQSGLSDKYIIQDSAIPCKSSVEFFDYLDTNFQQYPIWGPGPKKHNDFVAWNKAFEAKVHQLGGRKWLYAHSYYTEEEYWSIYDRNLHDKLRLKYHTAHLPSLYDKVKVDYAKKQRAMEEDWLVWLCAIFWSIWPLSGLYGWWHCIIAQEYLMPRKKI